MTDLDLIHEGTLTSLELSESENEQWTRAEQFFLAALEPITKLPRAGSPNKTQADSLSETLNGRTVELAASNRRLRRKILRRTSVETALIESARHHAALLKVSHQLQEGFRKLAHKLISAHEHQRKTLSHQLQDDILQSLLSVQVGLLGLKTTANGDLRKQVDYAQRLVRISAQSVDRFTHELDTHPQA